MIEQSTGHVQVNSNNLVYVFGMISICIFFNSVANVLLVLIDGYL